MLFRTQIGKLGKTVSCLPFFSTVPKNGQKQSKVKQKMLRLKNNVFEIISYARLRSRVWSVRIEGREARWEHQGLHIRCFDSILIFIIPSIHNRSWKKTS